MVLSVDKLDSSVHNKSKRDGRCSYENEATR